MLILDYIDSNLVVPQLVHSILEHGASLFKLECHNMFTDNIAAWSSTNTSLDMVHQDLDPAS